MIRRILLVCAKVALFALFAAAYFRFMSFVMGTA